MQNIKLNNFAPKSMIIGLTGGIGAGKSAVADILSAQNAYIIDADAVSKEVTGEGGECCAKIKHAFADCVVDGTLSKELLKKEVFENKQKRQLLNSITHPYILKKILAQIKQGINIIVVPLLFESGFNSLCSHTVCVTAPLDRRIDRIINRDKISKELAKKIIQAQIPQDQLIKKCDYVIENGGDMPALKSKVTIFWQEILKQLK